MVNAIKAATVFQVAQPFSQSFVGQFQINDRGNLSKMLHSFEKAAMVAAAVELAEKQLTEFKLWDLTSAQKRV